MGMLWISVTWLIRTSHVAAGLLWRLIVVCVIMSQGQADMARPGDIDCGPTVPPMVGWQRSDPCASPTTGYGSSVIENFAIQTFRGNSLNNVGLNMTWTATVTKPGNLFKLDMRVVIPRGIPTEPCTVFTMKTTSPSKQFFYNQFCQQFELVRHSVVEVKLWQLASTPKLVYQSNVTVIRQEEDYVGSSAKWVTDIMVYPDQCHRSIRADFVLAPVEYEFLEYSVSLVLPESLQAVSYDTVRPKSGDKMGSLTFYNITPENYTINVRAWQSILNKEFISNEISNANCTEKKNLMLPILLSCLGGLSLGIFAIIFVKKHKDKSCKISGPISICCGKPTPSPSPSSSSRKKIVLAHWADTSHHTDVVRCLEALLTQHFCCDVVDVSNTADDLNNVDAWVTDRLHSVDKIIVIESEGAYDKTYHRYLTYEHDQPDQFTPVWDYIKRERAAGNTTLLSRLISVQFEYTECTQLVSLPINTPHFCLMSDIKNLCRAIHASEGRESNAREYLNSDARHSREWSDLTYAIEKMHDFLSNQLTVHQRPATPPDDFTVIPPIPVSLEPSISSSRIGKMNEKFDYENQYLLHNGDANSVLL